MVVRDALSPRPGALRRSLATRRNAAVALALGGLAALAACVPSGTAPPYDGGTKSTGQKLVVQAPDILTTVFEDNFDDRKDMPDTVIVDASRGPLLTPVLDAAALGIGKDGGPSAKSDAGFDAGSLLLPTATASSQLPAAPPSKLGPNWYQSKTTAWAVENGKLCGRGARNHGVWLTRPIPINARIEFDATATSTEGDLKGEFWGDGQSSATTVSYTNATSYLAILGGWKNTFHVLARINEHGGDRKEIKVDKDSDDSRQHPVSVGQAYRFKVERSDGKTVRFFVNGVEYLSFADAEPLAGVGHDHFGFNNWEVKTCYDNVRVTPL
jgi:hypothetical protein